MEAQAGITTVAGTPARRAARATPWAWFPADAATTPAGPILSLRERTWARAPLTLKEPPFCITSSFRYTSASAIVDRVGEYTSGVRIRWGRIRVRTASISGRVTMGREWV